MVLLDLFKQEEVFADDTLTFFTTDKDLLRNEKKNFKSPFKKCSDLLAGRFPAYLFDSVGRITACPETPKHNFNDLKDLLLSQDNGSDL